MQEVLLLLKLRLTQAIRIVKETGWRAALLFPVLAVLSGMGIMSVTQRSIIYLNLFACFIVYLTDLLRKDHSFLFLLKAKGKFLRIAEYSIIILLFNIYALSIDIQNVIYVLADIAFVVLWVSYYSGKPTAGLTKISKAITSQLPVEAYAAKYGARNLFAIMLIVWLLSFVAVFLGPVLPFFILLLPLFLLEHISVSEPREITQSHGTISTAINKQMRALAITLLILFTPQLIISILLWHNPIMILANVAACWVALSSVFYALLLRYSFRDTKFEGMTKGLRLLIFIILSPLLPVSIYLLYKQYKTAQCQLQPFLN